MRHGLFKMNKCNTIDANRNRDMDWGVLKQMKQTAALEDSL